MYFRMQAASTAIISNESNEYDNKTNDSHDNRNYNWSFRICERRNFGLVADQSPQQYGSLQP